MNTIPARPTTYRGIQMRSRLEASRAALLDDEGLDWEYEPRAYAGRGGQYLPDFVVHTSYAGDVFLEVKPTIDSALGTLARMQIIRESLPEAFLLLVVEGVGSYQLRPGETRWLWVPA